MSNSNRAKALPFLGKGPAQGDQKESQAAAQGFVAIAMIFARTWPFLKPYILGYWRELAFTRAGVEAAVVSAAGHTTNTPNSAPSDHTSSI